VARLINDFVQLALNKGPYTAGQANAEDAVRQSIIDLCERGGVWTHDLAFALQENVSDYPLDAPEQTRLVAIDTVDINGRAFKPLPGMMYCRCGGWHISVPDAKTIYISPTPYTACDEWITIHGWLAPTMELCEFPDFFYQEYGETIAFGAASRLLQQPKQEYTNQGLANRCFNLYEAGLTRAKNKRVLQRTTGPLLMRGGYF
jgi:hypothetical protein